jgi:hypothetical protein
MNLKALLQEAFDPSHETGFVASSPYWVSPSGLERLFVWLPSFWAAAVMSCLLLVRTAPTTARSEKALLWEAAAPRRAVSESHTGAGTKQRYRESLNRG